MPSKPRSYLVTVYTDRSKETILSYQIFNFSDEGTLTISDSAQYGKPEVFGPFLGPQGSWKFCHDSKRKWKGVSINFSSGYLNSNPNPLATGGRSVYTNGKFRYDYHEFSADGALEFFSIPSNTVEQVLHEHMGSPSNFYVEGRLIPTHVH